MTDIMEHAISVLMPRDLGGSEMTNDYKKYIKTQIECMSMNAIVELIQKHVEKQLVIPENVIIDEHTNTDTMQPILNAADIGITGIALRTAIEYMTENKISIHPFIDIQLKHPKPQPASLGQCIKYERLREQGKLVCIR